MRCQCHDQCCCAETVPAVAELVAAARAALDESQQFMSAWEFEPWKGDGEDLAARLRAAIQAFD